MLAGSSMETLCGTHQEEIELICNHPQCKNPLLCLLCFQEHSRHCSANFKSDIKRVKAISKDEQWVQECKRKRETLITQIEDLNQLKDEIHNENQKLMNQKFIDITNIFELKHLVWSNSLEGLKNLGNTDTAADLQEALETLKKLNFSHENHVERIKEAKQLETIISTKVEPLLDQVRGPLQQFKLHKERLEVHSAKIFQYLQNMNPKDLLKDVVGSVEERKQDNGEEEAEELRILHETHQILLRQKRESLEQRAQILKQVNDLKEENRALQAQNNSFNEPINAPSPLNRDNRDNNNEYQRVKDNFNDLALKMRDLNQQVLDLQKSLNDDSNASNPQNQKKEELLLDNNNPNHSLPSVFNSVDNLDSALDYSIIPINRYNVESKIIDSQHCETLHEWISQSQPKKFHLKLIYQASRDGFSAQTFHDNCDDKGATISLIKSKDHGKVFGGYTTKSWKCRGRGRCVADHDAFVFSLTHNEKYHCSDPQHAIYTHPKFLMVFGVGGDIGIKDDAHSNAESAWTNFPFRYQCEKLKDVCPTIANCHLAGSDKFTVEEIEVYQVVLLPE